MEPRASVRRFANRMEQRLAANDHKSGWLDANPYELVRRALDEIQELTAALEHGTGYDKEAADVANFVMMASEARTFQMPDDGIEGLHKVVEGHG